MRQCLPAWTAVACGSRQPRGNVRAPRTFLPEARARGAHADRPSPQQFPLAAGSVAAWRNWACPTRSSAISAIPRPMLAPPELKQVHPLGKSPVLDRRRGDRSPRPAPSSNISSTRPAGRLRPPEGSPERLRWTYWLHYAEGSAMPPLLLRLVFSVLPARSPALLRPLVRAIAGGDARRLHRSADQDAFRLHRERVDEIDVVRRRRVLRRRRDDELSARSRGRSRQRLRRPAEGKGVRRTLPRAPGLSARAGKGRALRLCVSLP